MALSNESYRRIKANRLPYKESTGDANTEKIVHFVRYETLSSPKSVMLELKIFFASPGMPKVFIM
jgi:hypothetical protein